MVRVTNAASIENSFSAQTHIGILEQFHKLLKVHLSVYLQLLETEDIFLRTSLEYEDVGSFSFLINFYFSLIFDQSCSLTSIDRIWYVTVKAAAP